MKNRRRFKSEFFIIIVDGYCLPHELNSHQSLVQLVASSPAKFLVFNE